MTDEKLITSDDYQRAARRVLPKMAYDYFSSGADDEVTLKANRKAFKRYELWYRVLVDVSRVDTSITLLGSELSMPVLIAPTAYQKMAHPDGELATARAATRAGTLMVVSTLGTTSLEDVSDAADGPKWFQLYVHKDRGFTKALIEKAEASGYVALVLTVDAPVLGRRLADERNAFALPEGLSMANLLQLAPDEIDTEGSALSAFVAARHDETLTWSDLDWIRSITSLPLILKGIVRSDDAARAAELGVDGLVVSNHGGRQLDGAPASLEALTEVVSEVGDSLAVMVDGGVRSGTDVLKALALGAKAVLVGRPILWGLAVDGESGVVSVLENLRGELIASMKLAGCADLKSISRDLVRKVQR